MRSIFLLIVCLVTVAAAEQAKYVFLFIGDGMGMAHVDLADAVRRNRGEGPLQMKQMAVVGSCSTYPVQGEVTDSAAAGTALACGVKTKNGVLGLDAQGNPHDSILVRAKAVGRKVGLISTVTLDHATPASFYAHVSSRNAYPAIADSLAGTGFDFIGGGGLTGSKDGKAWRRLEAAGYTVLEGEDARYRLGQAKPPVYLRRSAYAPMPSAIDDDPRETQLTDLVAGAISICRGDQGFAIMIEGGQIDWASHGNQAGQALREVLAFDAAIGIAREFASRHVEETLIVVTADHETGGLSLGNKATGYNWYPVVIARQRMSVGRFAERCIAAADADARMALLNEVFGFWTGEKLDGGALKQLQVDSKTWQGLRALADKDPKQFASVASAFFQQQAGIGWTTGCHTAISVPVYAQGVGAQAFTGSMTNTDLSHRLALALGLE